jgi:iron(III) transport system substrate-binding protein
MADLEAAANKDSELLIYTSNVDGLMKVISGAFEKAHPGITVNWIRLSSSTVFNRFAAEVQAGVVQADMLWTASTLFYQEKPDLFHKLTVDEVPGLDATTAVKPQNSSYVVTAVSPHNITYNTDLVSLDDLKAHLSSWNDLTDPRWTGHIALADPRTSTSVSSLLLMLGDEYGEDWLKAFGKQFQVIDLASSGAQQVAAGAYQMVLPTDNSHSAELRAKGAPVAIWTPSGPSHGLEHAMAIPTQAKHSAAAELFMSWVLSKEGQTVMCNINLVPVRSADDKCEKLSPQHVSPRDKVSKEVQQKMIEDIGLKP